MTRDKLGDGLLIAIGVIITFAIIGSVFQMYAESQATLKLEQYKASCEIIGDSNGIKYRECAL